MGVLTLALSARFVLPILASRWTWAAVIIASSIIFTSGIMFVRIRGTPWVGRTKEGTTWLAGGYQNQYGMEVQVIAGTCESRMSCPLSVGLTFHRWHPCFLLCCTNLLSSSDYVSCQATDSRLYLVLRYFIAFLCSPVTVQCQEPRYVISKKLCFQSDGRYSVSFQITTIVINAIYALVIKPLCTSMPNVY